VRPEDTVHRDTELIPQDARRDARAARPADTPRPAEAPHPRDGSGALFLLQAAAGNRAVTSLLQRRQSQAPPVQRVPDPGQQAAIKGKADSVAEQARDAAADHDQDDGPPQVDPAQKRAATSEQRGNFAQPDKVSAPAATVKQAATTTQDQVAAPTTAVGDKGGGKDIAAAAAPPALDPAAAGAEAAKGAVAQAAAVPEPAAPEPVTAPTFVLPLDATGATLPLDPAGEAVVGQVLGQLAQLRFGAHQQAVEAGAHRSRAHALRAGLAEAHGKLDESTNSIDTVKGHVAHRREVVGQAGTAHSASEEKADTVASGAPGIAEQADSGKTSSGPMASESGELAASASSQAPDDEEAAEKANQQSGQVSQVNKSLTSIDSAIGQAGQRARSLQADAAAAKVDNTKTAATITEATGKLDQTDAKLGELAAQNQAARAQVTALAGHPDEIAAGADTQDAEAQAMLDRSRQLEARVHQTQATYAAQLQEIPGPPRRRGTGAGGAADSVQRQAAPERERVASAGQLAAWISGDEETQAERVQHATQAQQRQQAELATINAECGGDFQRLDSSQKASLALRLTFSRTFGSLASTSWPKFGKDLLRGFVDPRVSLAGIVSGLGMIASGGANLLSAKQWAADPLGNLLKSTADIATGVTIVLGSVAGLAIAIIAISAALILVSFGFLAPALLPVISFCSFIAATVGPWAVTAAEIALVLNGLVFIKNLIDAATASTAADLQQKSVAMGEDVNAMGTAAMQIAGEKVGEVIGPRVSGALEGVESRLASSGTTIGTNIAGNMSEIGSAMAEGQTRAQGLPPPAPGPAEAPAGTEPASAPAAGEVASAPAGPAPEVAEPGTVPPGAEAAPPTAAEATPTTGEAPPASTEPPAAGEQLGTHEGQPVVAEAAAPGGGTVEVTAEGKCALCASPCTDVHEHFPEALEDPALEAKLDTAEAVTDPQAKAEAVAEVVPELSAAEANAHKLSELEARIDELPETTEANRLRGAFEKFKGQFEPGAGDAPQRLAEVERLVDEQTPGPEGAPADESVWGDTETQKAVRGDAAEQLEANGINGSDAEQAVIMGVMEGEVIPELGSTAKLRGTQVEVRVPPNGELRIIDVVVELPSGEVVALEVKSGNATRTERQIRLDDTMSKQGVRVVASDEGVFPSGPHQPIRTVVVRH
jgi:hypothetical protein